MGQTADGDSSTTNFNSGSVGDSGDNERAGDDGMTTGRGAGGARDGRDAGRGSGTGQTEGAGTGQTEGVDRGADFCEAGGSNNASGLRSTWMRLTSRDDGEVATVLVLGAGEVEVATFLVVGMEEVVVPTVLVLGVGLRGDIDRSARRSSTVYFLAASRGDGLLFVTKN